MSLGLVFTYVLTYGGAIASMVNPFVGLLAYVCFAIIRPESLWFWSVQPGNFSRVVAIALILGWAGHGFGNWNLGKSAPAMFAIIGYWCWSAVSTIFCEDQSAGLLFLENSGKIVLPVVIGITLITSWEQVRLLAWTIALSQGYVAYDLNMSYFDGFNRLEQYGFGSMDNNSATIAMVTGVGLSFFLGLSTQYWIMKLAAFAASAFMTHAVFFSFSRGGMIALVAVGLATFVLLPKRVEHLVLFGMGTVLAIAMVGDEVWTEFNSSFADRESLDSSSESRLELWYLCSRMLAENPLFGVGPDHFGKYVDDFALKHGTFPYPEGKEAHTTWLQTAAELGVPGVFMLVTFFVYVGWELMRRRKSLDTSFDPIAASVSSMVLSSLAGYFVAAQFVTLEGLEIPYYVAMLGAGVLRLNSERDQEDSTSLQHVGNELDFRPPVVSATAKASQH